MIRRPPGSTLFPSPTLFRSHFDYVHMPDYRWGIFLNPAEADARVGFGDNMGQPAYQEVPGEFRNALRRIVVTQADTEPASVEQQRRQIGRASCRERV